tara:strand:+ start:22887 stop:22994 length:108 start_codon:yes stop_codon:yes gene_type:complete
MSDKVASAACNAAIAGFAADPKPVRRPSHSRLKMI